MNWSWLDWAAAALGGTVGVSGLISRYKDDPWAAIQSWPAVFYLAINSAASVGALFLMPDGWWDLSRGMRILMAGVSAMAFFRTSLFVVRAADRRVDRKRAAARSQAVVDAMKNVDYSKAKDALPPYCLALMQNISKEDQQELSRDLKD
jgi:hypothetical protein